jgi:GDP-L-fucose synthase
MELRGKSVLVTGATGLLGRPLVDALLARGARVLGTGIERRPDDWPGCGYQQLDLLTQGWGWLLGGVDYVFHLAGGKGGVGIGRSRAYDFININLQPTLQLLGELRARARDGRPIGRLLFVSSVGAYPGDRTVFYEHDLEGGPPHQSDYFGGYTKRFGEVMCKAAREQFGLDYVVVRPTNCYGPYDRFDPETGMVIAALIARAEAGENPLKVWGDGTAARDFLYSKNAADQMLVAMERGVSGEAYNLGTGYTQSIRRILDILKIVAYPNLTWTFDETKPTGPQSRQMSIEKLLKLNPQTFARMRADSLGLAETVYWYRENKHAQKYDPFK